MVEQRSRTGDGHTEIPEAGSGNHLGVRFFNASRDLPIMTTHHIPKGVSLDTLKDIIAGWDAVGAAAEPTYTSAVEEETGITDAVGRQTRFLEEVGVLEEGDDQKQRLTGEGQELASALAADDEERARERAHELLSVWPVTEQVRGILRQNPTDEETLVPLVAHITGHDLDVSRVRSGITTLLDLYEWAGLLDRGEQNRYRLPDEEGEGTEKTEESEGGETGVAGDGGGVPTAVEASAGGPEEMAERSTVEGLASKASKGEDDVEAALEALAEATGASDVETLLAEVTSAVKEARDAAEEARKAARKAGGTTDADAADADESVSVTAGPDSSPDTDHALSLEVNLDADPEDLEPIVRALRRGLIRDEGADAEGE